MPHNGIKLLLLCILASGITSYAVATIALNRGGAEPRPTTVAPAAAPVSASSAAAARILPSVVSVRGIVTDGGYVASGSGVIIDGRRGLIATNHHVVTDAARVRITLSDRREYTAQVIGTDRQTDLALLRVADAPDLPAASFGDSDALRTGDALLSVGNPYGLNSTVTSGILSGRGRAIDVLTGEDRIESFLQTDAAVHPGNSGGALVNAAGELIGITTAILTGSGRHEGFAFAIPGNLARRVLADLRDFGSVRRAALGAFVQSLNDAQAKRLGMEVARGAYLTTVLPAGPAARAGLRRGDVLLSLNGRAINGSPELHERLSEFVPGDSVALRVRQGREERTLTVRLAGPR